MGWTFGQRAQLLRLAEAGTLTREQVQRAAIHAPLQPAAHEWQEMFERLLVFGGALLLGAAAVFFFAYNWDELHRFAKFALACAALVACGLVALWSAPRGIAFRAALFGACIATGALFALIGQAYQTGADVWELFAAWAALMLPFVLLSRSSASWALCLLVLNAALLRALSQSASWTYFNGLFELLPLLTVAALNLAVLLMFEGIGHALLDEPRRWMARLAAIGVVAPLCMAAVMGWSAARLWPGLPIFALAVAAGVVVYRSRRQDIAVLALLSYATIVVLTAGLAELINDRGFLALNGLGLFVILSSAAAGRWLMRLYRAGSTQGSAA